MNETGLLLELGWINSPCGSTLPDPPYLSTVFQSVVIHLPLPILGRGTYVALILSFKQGVSLTNLTTSHLRTSNYSLKTDHKTNVHIAHSPRDQVVG